MRVPGSDLVTPINGLQVGYNDWGPDDAPVIIFIHGFPLNKSMWDKQLAALRGEYRVVAYDVRGHGSSEAGNEDFSIKLFAYDLLCLMEALHIDRAMLCGHSMGGYIALYAVENYPKRFDGMILCDTNCIADTEAVKEARIKTMEKILDNGIDKYAADCVQDYFSPFSIDQKIEDLETVLDMAKHNSSESLCNTLFALAGRRESCSRLLEIELPTLILVGENDAITPPAEAHLMHVKIRGSILALIAHSGHLPNLENTPQFNAQLADFAHHHLPLETAHKRA